MSKLRLTFKDPDGPYDAIAEEARRQAEAIDGLDDDEREAVAETRLEKIREVTNKWLRWGEYLSVDIDLETGAATVVPASTG